MTKQGGAMTKQEATITTMRHEWGRTLQGPGSDPYDCEGTKPLHANIAEAREHLARVRGAFDTFHKALPEFEYEDVCLLTAELEFFRAHIASALKDIRSHLEKW